ncbi:MAG: ABC transporter permease, partial [Pseudomonadota bacterium]
EVAILGIRSLLSIPKRPWEIRALLTQVLEQGNRAIGLSFVMSGFAGLVLTFQFGEGLQRFGARQYIGQLTALALLRELMPVLTALILGGRIAAGIAAELGAMVASEQVDAIRALGADPLKKLAMPRIVAATVVLPLLTVLGDVVGVVAGMGVARLEFEVPAHWYLLTVRDFLLVSDFLSGVVKSAVFGLVLGVVACDAGLRSRGGTEGVGRATTSAVVVTSLTVIILDYLLSRMLFPSPGVGR